MSAADARGGGQTDGRGEGRGSLSYCSLLATVFARLALKKMRINCRQGKPHWPHWFALLTITTTSYRQCHKLPLTALLPPPTPLCSPAPTVAANVSVSVSVSAVKQQMESGNFQLLVHFRRDCETQLSVGGGEGRAEQRGESERGKEIEIESESERERLGSALRITQQT